MDQPDKVANPARIIFFLSSFAPENLVPQDGFGSPVQRQPAHLYTQAKSGAYLRNSSRVPRCRGLIGPIGVVINVGSATATVTSISNSNFPTRTKLTWGSTSTASAPPGTGPEDTVQSPSSPRGSLRGKVPEAR